MNNFSPHMLKTYQTCPKKYFLQYVERVQIPRSALLFEKGKKIHALANYFLQGINISRIETALTPEEYQTWQELLNNPFFKKDCLHSEYTLSCKLDEYWIGGRLDAVVQDGENYYILDYKTGSTPKNPQYDFQTMIYLLCLDKKLEKYSSLAFVYINLKTKNNYVIDFNETLKQEYKNLIIEECSKISSDFQYAPKCANCSTCEFSKICQN
jgi:ATP-dependent exoDNAse (exonuclease V) beta subunit